MKGTECKFLKYMSGADKRFVIPVYQRNYDWKTENCKQLYDDLVKIIKSGRKSHFFGSLVSVYHGNKHQYNRNPFQPSEFFAVKNDTDEARQHHTADHHKRRIYGHIANPQKLYAKIGASYGQDGD